MRPAMYNVDDLVWHYSPRRYKGRSPKWEKMYNGPFTVVKLCGPVNYLIQRSPRTKPFVSHVDKLKPYYSTGMEEDAPTPERERPDDGTAIDDAGIVLDRPRRTIRRPTRFL